MPNVAPRLIVLIACALIAGALLGSRPVLAAEAVPLAIKGYDPVAYFALQRATPGVAEFAYDWDEHRWQFSNAKHRDLFKADPVRYAPQFANFCAVALSRGEVREANPEYWLISEGRLYLFGKSVGPDLFRKNPASTLESAHQNRALLPKKP
jgi:YHS domain-containing protein